MGCACSTEADQRREQQRRVQTAISLHGSPSSSPTGAAKRTTTTTTTPTINDTSFTDLQPSSTATLSTMQDRTAFEHGGGIGMHVPASDDNRCDSELVTGHEPSSRTESTVTGESRSAALKADTPSSHHRRPSAHDAVAVQRRRRDTSKSFGSDLEMPDIALRSPSVPTTAIATAPQQRRPRGNLAATVDVSSRSHSFAVPGSVFGPGTASSELGDGNDQRLFVDGAAASDAAGAVLGETMLSPPAGTLAHQRTRSNASSFISRHASSGSLMSSAPLESPNVLTVPRTVSLHSRPSSGLGLGASVFGSGTIPSAEVASPSMRPDASSRRGSHWSSPNVSVFGGGMQRSMSLTAEQIQP